MKPCHILSGSSLGNGDTPNGNAGGASEESSGEADARWFDFDEY